jgi:hypothetical protein
MPIGRMNREQFFAQLASLDEQRLKKALWNLYWRGAAAIRERIEAEISPDQQDRGKRRADQPADPQQLLDEVRDFVALARSGAYIAGDRRVSPRERTRWRFTFQRLVSAARDGLRAKDKDKDIGAAAAAVEQLIDLACETRDYEYFHSEDPVEAARFVVSDAVALLWATLQAHHGFAGFAERAAPQLIRWESPYGWTRSGYGRLARRKPRSPACSQRIPLGRPQSRPCQAAGPLLRPAPLPRQLGHPPTRLPVPTQGTGPRPPARLRARRRGDAGHHPPPRHPRPVQRH